MNVVFTVNTYYPMKDGVSSVTQYLAEGLIKKGHKVIVLTRNYNKDKKSELINGVEIIRYNINVRNTFYFGEKSKFVSDVIRYSRESDALINVAVQCPTTDWCFDVLNKIKCKKILYVHGMYDFNFFKMDFAGISNIGHKVWNQLRWGVYYSANNNHFRMYDKVVNLHEFDNAKLYFEKEYNIESFIIENAAEDVFFEDCENILDLPEKYILCVSNYLPMKNQEMLLEAFWKANLEDYSLIFIGSKKNSYYNSLLNMSEKLNCSCTKFLTEIPRSQIPEYTKRASICVMSSRHEAFPMSIVEAMAANTAIISTDVGCVKYLPGTITVQNIEEMVYWLRILANYPELSKDYAKIGNQYAKLRMSIDSKVTSLETLIRRDD